LSPGSRFMSVAKATLNETVVPLQQESKSISVGIRRFMIFPRGLNAGLCPLIASRAGYFRTLFRLARAKGQRNAQSC